MIPPISALCGTSFKVQLLLSGQSLGQQRMVVSPDGRTLSLPLPARLPNSTDFQLLVAAMDPEQVGLPCSRTSAPLCAISQGVGGLAAAFDTPKTSSTIFALAAVQPTTPPNRGGWWRRETST